MYQEFNKGWVEVICGPMFAGKSEELIRRIRTLKYANKKIICFKPDIDNRYDDTKIASHVGNKLEAIPVKSSDDIRRLVTDDIEVIGIDEIQFLDEGILDLIQEYASNGKRIIVSGLDMDFRGEPFSFMPKLLAQAEFVTKLTACCTVCGSAATRTQRIVDDRPAYYEEDIIVVGAKECYQARCRKHHLVPHKEEK